MSDSTAKWIKVYETFKRMNQNGWEAETPYKPINHKSY